jgi:hypothetical protein
MEWKGVLALDSVLTAFICNKILLPSRINVRDILHRELNVNMVKCEHG